jgi:uncharacterized RDD family membrane protein YckC
MSRFKVATNINIDLEFELPSFHLRLFAWMIDIVIFIIYLFTIFKLFSTVFRNMNGEDEWGLFLLLLLPIALYHVVLESTMQGQTVGKRLMHIKVINEMGGNATISQYVIRWLLRVSDFMMLIIIFMLLAYRGNMGSQALMLTLVAVADVFCVALTKKGQRLGDMAAGTILIKTKNKSNLAETVFVDTDDNYVPKYPEVMKLSDRDMNMVKNILNTIIKKDDYQLAARTAYKICDVLKIDLHQDPQAFLETLLKDYNHLSTK